MNTNIYCNKIIVFKSDARNALQAAAEIDSELYCYVQIFETVVTVTIDVDVEEPKYNRSIEKTMDKCTKILKKYGIDFKIKGMRF